MIRPRHASHISVGALALAALLLPAFAAAQPSLAYDPPAGWTRGPYSSPVVYTAPGGEAELHVYDFRRYAGDAKRRFHQTRLYELIGIEHRETGPLDPAKDAEIHVQGAGAVPLAIFLEQRGGVNRLHVRVAIAQPGAVALVDYHARGQDAGTATCRRWTAGSRRCGWARPRLACWCAAARARGERALPRHGPPLGVPGHRRLRVDAQHRVLPARPGRENVQGWLPEAPGGGFLRFDYDEARRPGGNSAIGSYTVSGNRVSLNVGNERTTGTLLGPDELEIAGRSTSARLSRVFGFTFRATGNPSAAPSACAGGSPPR